MDPSEASSKHGLMVGLMVSAIFLVGFLTSARQVSGKDQITEIATHTSTPHASDTPTHLPSSTPTPHSTDTATPTASFTPTATIIVPVQGTADLSIQGVDLNQAVSEFRSIPYTASAPGNLNGGGSVAKIAGKDTILRVYPRLMYASTLNGISGTVNGYSCGSSTPLGSPVTPMNPGGQLDFTSPPTAGQFYSTLNFQLPTSWITGCLSLVIDINTPIGTEDPALLGNNTLNWSNILFSPVVPVNLILAPYIYAPPFASFPLTPDIINTPMLALGWLNNAYPLPGNFPQSNTGVNVQRILPIQTTNYDLRLTSGNQNMDRFREDLRAILTNLLAQNSFPLTTKIMGMTPCGCGGYADIPGNVSYVDTWAQENGALPIGQIAFYGPLWAQELGHNYGRDHAGNWHGEIGFDANYPYVHGGIGRYGLAINTDTWQPNPDVILPGTPSSGDSGQSHAHDFMSYGSSPSWVSDYTYNGLFNPFPTTRAQSLPVRRAAAVEQVVIAGHIHDNQVAWQPFYRIMTDYVSSNGMSGDYGIELQNSGGDVLSTFRFSPHAATHGVDSGAVGFSEFVPWQLDTAKIVLKLGDTVLAEKGVSPHTPVVTLVSPNGGETLGDQVSINWMASDEDGDELYFTILYNDGKDPLWWPIATNVTGTSHILDASLLPGSGKGWFKIRVTDGVNTAEDESDASFIVPEKSPHISIIHPIHGEHIHVGEDANLVAAVFDPEDGYLPDDSLVWDSSLDGEIGHGHHVHHGSLTPGTHILTLNVTDSQGQAASYQITVTVGYDIFLPVLGR